jgi:hypothetical protein
MTASVASQRIFYPNAARQALHQCDRRQTVRARMAQHRSLKTLCEEHTHRFFRCAPWLQNSQKNAIRHFLATRAIILAKSNFFFTSGTGTRVAQEPSPIISE